MSQSCPKQKCCKHFFWFLIFFCVFFRDLQFVVGKQSVWFWRCDHVNTGIYFICTSAEVHSKTTQKMQWKDPCNNNAVIVSDFKGSVWLKEKIFKTLFNVIFHTFACQLLNFCSSLNNAIMIMKHFIAYSTTNLQ